MAAVRRYDALLTDKKCRSEKADIIAAHNASVKQRHACRTKKAMTGTACTDHKLANLPNDVNHEKDDKANTSNLELARAGGAPVSDLEVEPVACAMVQVVNSLRNLIRMLCTSSQGTLKEHVVDARPRARFHLGLQCFLPGRSVP